MLEKCRNLIRGHEGTFLTMLVGNPALYLIPNSEAVEMLVDAMMVQNPQEFVSRVGQYLLEEVEVA